MNFEDYFEKPQVDTKNSYILPACYSFATQLNCCDYKIALIGLPADDEKFNCGSCNAPDEIRKHLYSMRTIDNVKVTDLGNLRCGSSHKDTYYALRDVVSELIENGVTPVIIGGSQDYTVALYEAISENNDEVTLTVIDSKIDFGSEVDNLKDPEINSKNFLNHIFKSNSLYRFNILGQQGYFCSDEQLYEIQNRNFCAYRLGVIRADLVKSEPMFRDTDLLSLDISAIRHSDAPGQEYPVPNGFFGEEVCQLVRYAGLSDKMKVFGLFEVNPFYDNNCQTSNLAAEIIWHFIEAFGNRYGDYPKENILNYQKIIVPELDGNDEKVFYFNRLNKRWWIEIPTEKGKRIFACSATDFAQAKKGEIPDIWMKFYLK